MIALAGLMMFAFTPCGGKDENGKEKTVQGTVEFKDAMKVLDDYEKAIGNAKSCEDLKKAKKDFREAANKLDDKEYGDKEKLTPEEKDKLTIKQAEIKVKERKKCRQYKCDGCKMDWENNDRKGSDQVSKEYKDVSKAFDECEKAISKAKSCDDLKNVELKIDYKKEYSDKEKMTPEEEDKLIIRNAELTVKENKKCREFQCDWCKGDWEKK